ncbi:MAG: metal-dependent hydrolase [Acidobacteria bacterium]|nr:metal-dependent hydrolase [Acidobacteriota bacterium]
MDNLCHTLTGAALGQAGLANRTRYGMVTLLVASNLPDIDVAVFFTNTMPVSFRRGWTHGVLAQVLLPVALAAVVWLVGRRQTADNGRQQARGQPNPALGTQPSPVFAQLLLLSYIGLYSHVFLDYLNSYGLRVLMPFSGHWFYGDALYIVDPLMWLVLGAGVAISARAARLGSARPWRPARLALAATAAYTVVMLASNTWARAVVRHDLTRAGQAAETPFMVTPVFGNPFRREVLVDTGSRYEKGQLWFEPAPHFRPLGYGVDKGFNQPEARSALATPRAEAFLGWSRFPFLVVDRSEAPARVFLNDYRYSDAGGRAGWAGLRIQAGD